MSKSRLTTAIDHGRPKAGDWFTNGLQTRKSKRAVPDSRRCVVQNQHDFGLTAATWRCYSLKKTKPQYSQTSSTPRINLVSHNKLRAGEKNQCFQISKNVPSLSSVNNLGPAKLSMSPVADQGMLVSINLDQSGSQSDSVLGKSFRRRKVQAALNAAKVKLLTSRGSDAGALKPGLGDLRRLYARDVSHNKEEPKAGLWFGFSRVQEMLSFAAAVQQDKYWPDIPSKAWEGEDGSPPFQCMIDEIKGLRSASIEISKEVPATHLGQLWPAKKDAAIYQSSSSKPLLGRPPIHQRPRYLASLASLK